MDLDSVTDTGKNVGSNVSSKQLLFKKVDADKKGLSKNSEEVKLLAQKAKDNNLKPEDYEFSPKEMEMATGSKRKPRRDDEALKALLAKHLVI